MVTTACAPVDRSLRRELWQHRPMLHRPSFARAGAAGLGLSLAALFTAAFASCSSSDTPHLGGLGATCTKSADCESSLHCIDSVCTDSSATSAGGAGGGG